MNAIALSDEQLRHQAPSVFATRPIHAVSSRYGFVPTIEVVDNLRDQGWDPVYAGQTKVKDLARLQYTRHVVRFRQLGAPLQVGDCIAELVLTNSHDRSSVYALDFGLHRVLCANGMIAAIGRLGGSFRVRHGRNIVGQVLEGSSALIEELPAIAASLDRFQERRLTWTERHAFAEAALAARYGENWLGKSPVRPDQLLEPRRDEDFGDDLWRTYNTVQENLLKGGIEGRSTHSGRRVSTRRIRSVSADIRLNQALWALAERFAALKQAA